MSLEHILLGLLRDPASGYDLRKAFDGGPRHFWSARLSQIYPALQGMERRGWLTSRSERSPRGPARRVYRRTGAGTRAFRKWLLSRPELAAERLAYVGQLVFLGELADPSCTLRFLEDLRARFSASKRRIDAEEAALRAAHSGPPRTWESDDFHELLCLRVGARAVEARVAACEECIALARARVGRRKGRR